MIKTARQLKDLIRNLSKDKAADAQILMRNYMMERFLERISLSEYRDKFILKGGMLVAAMVGLDARSTMDIDATVKGATVGIEEVENMIASIISVPVDDGVEFRVKRISEIMDEAEYPGIRISMETEFDGVITPLKTDISTGDAITPREVRYSFKLMLEDGEATRLTVMNAALDRIEAVLDEPELPDNGNQHILSQAQPDQPEVQFSDVGFAYQDKEVLHNISFSMQKNTMTALVGPSGGGKSTIANLLARLWDVKSGKVTIRGTDIRDVPLAELMEQISMVFQRVYLFQDTIYNNISMGKPDATEEEVYEAAKKARCYDFIMALPDGFQTVIGEGGATLSGGEKQRISIARCILKDAPIVILDEATASVDTDNESYIQEAINELVKGKTLLVIAHRLNTIRQADQILVISDGRISEQGTHDELMAKAGIYQDFVNIRKKASGWSLA